MCLHIRCMVAVVVFGTIGIVGCGVTTEELRNAESSLRRDVNRANARVDFLNKRMDAMSTAKADRARLQDVMNRLGDQERNLLSMRKEKADRAYVNSVEMQLAKQIQDLSKRVDAVEYELRTIREEFLTWVSLGYRMTMRAARECAIEIEPTLSRILREQEADAIVFIRDFRTLDDSVTVLGDLLSREFSVYLRKRATIKSRFYREEQVIREYQQKKLKVPDAERFKLENLEKAGFRANVVLVLSGRITPTERTYRVDVLVTNLKDPTFETSVSRQIPRDTDVDGMYSKELSRDTGVPPNVP